MRSDVEASSSSDVRVRLLAVDEQVLERLVGIAAIDATANEVTPAPDGSHGWTPDRLAWLRAFHRDRRGGLDAPRGEQTWAVVAGPEILGSVRLAKSHEPGVLEIGIWLARSARGRGVAREACLAAVDIARGRPDIDVVVAATTGANAGAQQVLQSLGFTVDPPSADDRVSARLFVGDAPPGPVVVG